jgi:cyclic beta-1,2-glucan synthetase
VTTPFSLFAPVSSSLATLKEKLLSAPLASGPETPWRPQVLSREALGELALSIAEQHRGTFLITRSTRLLTAYSSNRAMLRRVYLRLAEAAHKGETLTAGAEWLLDNYHVVERHAAAIKKYLPWSFYRTLPKFTQGEFKGFPRVYHLALEFIMHTDAALDSQLASFFLSTYQQKLELSSGELWAFPIMLRFALLENLRRLTREAERELLARRDVFSLVDNVLGDESRTGTEIMVELARRLSERESFLPHGALELLRRLRGRGRKAFMALQFLEEALRERGLDPEDLLRAEDHNQAARQISVGNTLTSLTAIDQMNWREWFEGVSLADRVLKGDPANLYVRSDFPTRDALRHEVELLAKALKTSDSQVSSVVIECAKRAATTHPGTDPQSLVAKHVGHFLIGEGRAQLERELNYTPPLHRSLTRFLTRHALATYLGSFALISFLLLGYLCLISKWGEASALLLVVTLLIGLLPVSELASSLVQYLVSRWVIPRPLPKLSIEGPVPSELKTLVVVHTIFSSPGSVQRAIDGLEVRFLANDDPAFTYVLMADLPDARTEQTSLDDSIVAAAAEGIEVLNHRHAPNGAKRFLLFFRSRLWNPHEGAWMAWERKRGKLEELNRYLLGDTSTTLQLVVGEHEQLRGIKYVITLDSDSQLSRDVAKKLVATISHPMNRPVIDPRLNRVVRGYAFIQPRVTISLTSATNSFFSRLFSGQAGLDPYTNVVSEVYQDLFGEGSFWGKGIYDVESFERVLHNRVPENALLSHDLFEGSFARVALASDIELYDDFPSRYMAYSKRLHRWVRGDWQLLPWLNLNVPTRGGRARNQLSCLSLWKMFDNLRRSLLPPASLIAILGGWLFLPGGPLVWTVLILLVMTFPMFTGLASVFALPSVGISLGGFLGDIGRDLWRNTIRALCGIAFLPHQAGLMLHAISVTLYRVYISKKNLLEWEPAERSERRGKNEHRDFLRLFALPMTVATVACIVAAMRNESTLSFSLPIMALWISSPWLARWVSQPTEASAAKASEADERYLRSAAYDTWRFFDDHLREEFNYLMPDNLQIIPKEVIAERTSPTNISLSILSGISAYDLGFIPFNDAISRASHTVATMTRMEKYRGHLFNWYAIRTLAPLHPRYISTVDSGNLLGHLYTLLTILERAGTTPLLIPAHAHALRAALNECGSAIAALEDTLTPSLSELKREVSNESTCQGSAWVATITNLAPDFTAQIREAAESLPANRQALLKVAYLVDQIRKTSDSLEWIAALQELVALSRRTPQAEQIRSSAEFTTLATKANEVFQSVSHTTLSSHQIEDMASLLLPRLHAAIATAPTIEIKVAAERVSTSLERAQAAAREFADLVANIQQQVSVLIREMDFSFLFDEGRSLFTIGFNTEHARRDASFYDLLASEARLLSFLAVARGEVSQKHWFSLGRSLATTPGGKALISWSGTMFEYLMPFVVMKDFPTTILGRTGRAVVGAQIAYGRRQSVPWGISESAYSGVDFEKTYQYRAFGVPGLGLKRGLSEDLVVSPYSTFLALPFVGSIDIAVDNLRMLEQQGARGAYGFYEAVDYTPSRHLRADGKHVVQSFFAHHQGMSLVSINNALNDGIMCERFHAQPIVKSTELLLHERFPDRVATIVPHEPELATIQREEAPKEEPGLEIVTSPNTVAPRVRILSNGRYSVMVDSSGAGFSSFDRSIFLTRWREDPTSSPLGSFIYVHDIKSDNLWSVAYQPSRSEPDSYEAIFSPGRAEFKRFDQKVFVHTEITVAPEDDVELRRVTVTNLGDTEREFDIISYIEPVLNQRRADYAHPAFNKLFVRAEVLKDYDAIMFSRRPRTEHEKEIFFFHRVTLKTSYAPIIFETSRADFIGRGGSLERPAAVARPGKQITSAESSIDPLASLRCRIRLEPSASETLVFVSGAARVRKDAQALLERYQELMHVNRAFELSWSRAQVELRSHAYTASQADLFHRLAGCLLYNESSVRGAPEVLSLNRLPQSGLWRFGISGDLPIVLAKVTDSRQTKVVQELLLAHHFLRERGLEFDLVILHTNPGTYMQHLAEDLEYVVRLSPAGHLLDRPGGVFLRSSSQISESEAALLETVARVVVTAEIGGLAETLKTASFDQSAPTPVRAQYKRSPGRERSESRLLLSNGIGGFNPSSNHYLMPHIGASRPPLPWANVVANPHFGFIATDSGIGYTWSENSRENRLTTWTNDPVLDQPSEVVYLRRSDTGEYWSLTPAPAGAGLDYGVEHGFGSSTYTTANAGIESKLELTGSVSERVKWLSITLSNTEAVEHKLELYFYADLVLGVSREESYRYVTTGFDLSSQVLYAVNHYNNEFAGRVVALGSSEPVVSHTGSRLEFLGRNGDTGRPAALERGAVTPFFASKPKPIKLSAKTEAGHDPCAVLHVSLALKPKEERTLHFFISESPNMDSMRRETARYRSLQTQKVEAQAVTQWWNSLLSSVTVRTPSEPFNVMMNSWLLYQTVSCRLFGRSAFYQSGGAIGFRDQLQDSLALLAIRPDVVRNQIILHAARQFREGDVQHWWHPPTGRGVRTRISDDLLWLPYAVGRYIEATGDYSILNQRAPFLHGAALAEDQMENYFVPEQNAEEGTILEHCLRTFKATAAVGAHGLPLIGCGDWNDGMNEVGRHGKGESVWLAWFQIEVINRFAPVLEAQGDAENASMLRSRARALKDAAEQSAWDGRWYRRAFYDDGTPIGSSQNDECRIDSLAQTWSVISGAGDRARAAMAMQAMNEELVDTEGGLIKLLTPPFDKTLKNPGYIKGYPPGIRENGGQYTHAAAWTIIATALLGKGTKAFELFDLINPVNHARDARGVEKYRAEPYVMCGDVYSEGDLRGRAGWSWYTGSSGWLYQAGLEYIIGLKVHPTSFSIDPVIPADWSNFSVTLRRAERSFAITVMNEAGVERGVRSVEVNGVPISGNTVAYEDPSYGAEVVVRVVMGTQAVA